MQYVIFDMFCQCTKTQYTILVNIDLPPFFGPAWRTNSPGGLKNGGRSLFDHSIRIFTQLNAHYQIKITRELQKAHNGLITATNALRVAIWWLAIVTVLLGSVEITRKFGIHLTMVFPFGTITPIALGIIWISTGVVPIGSPSA
jgi:hypothetical protein